MAENRKLKVFLCHSKGDKLKVKKFYRRLIADGFDVWLDEEKLLPGQDWDFEIKKAVRNTDTVIICLSKDSVTKEGYIQKEISFALNIADEKPQETIFLIPVRIEECEVPHRLSRLHYIDLFTRKGYQKTVEALNLRMDDLKIRFTEKEVASTKNLDFIKMPILGELVTNRTISPNKQLTSNHTDNVEISKQLIPSNIKVSNLFALRAIGDSMADAMIHDGDLVVIEPTANGKNGDMVVVWLSNRNETTLKYFYKENDGYRLQPANPEFKSILISNNEPLEIKGKVVMVIRKVKS